MLANPVPGTAAQVLSAILRDAPSSSGGRATFSLVNFPDLPSLGTEVVWLPQYAVLDANGEFTGMLISQGWATKGITAVTGAYIPQPSDAVVLCDATTAAFTVTLPDATQPGYSPGQRYTVVKTDSSAHAVTVNASAGQLIGGASTVTLTGASSFTSVVFDGVNTNNWWVWAQGSSAGTVVIDTTAADIVALGNQAAGAVGKAADSGHVHPASTWVPADNGIVASTASIDTAGVGSGSLTAGTLYLVKMPVRASVTVTKVWFLVSTAAVGASTGTHIGLYSSSGSLMASSDTGEIGTTFTSSGPQSATFGASQSLTGGTFVWVGLIVNFATTQAGLRTFSNNIQNLSNLNTTAATSRIATNGTGLTALPASITPSSNSTLTGNPLWFGVS